MNERQKGTTIQLKRWQYLVASAATFVLFFLSGICVVWLGFWVKSIHDRYVSSKSWPKVDARVVSVEVAAQSPTTWDRAFGTGSGSGDQDWESYGSAERRARERGEKDFPWLLTCHHEYSWKDKKYNGSFEGKTWHRKLQTKKQTGEPIRLWINPNDPSETLFVRADPEIPWLAVVAFGLVFTIVGALCWPLCLVRYFKLKKKPGSN